MMFIWENLGKCEAWAKTSHSFGKGSENSLGGPKSWVGLGDADLGLQDLLLRFQYSNTHTHGLQRSCGGKGTEQPLSQEESASEGLGHSLKGGAPRALPRPAFIGFSGP